VGHDCSLEYMKRIQFLILTRPDTPHSLVHETRGGLPKGDHPESLGAIGIAAKRQLIYSCSRQAGHRPAATLGSLLSVPFLTNLNGHLVSASGLAVHRITAFGWSRFGHSAGDPTVSFSAALATLGGAGCSRVVGHDPRIVLPCSTQFLRLQANRRYTYPTCFHPFRDRNQLFKVDQDFAPAPANPRR
jgi:hypothetical protein